MIHGQGFDPPEPCSACDVYYEYKDGLCWECWHEAQEILEVERAENRALRDMEESR